MKLQTPISKLPGNSNFQHRKSNKLWLFRILSFGFVLSLGLVIWGLPKAQAVSLTWDGEGTDDLCGGVGTANNWNCVNNWTTNTVPGTSDIAVFNATSTKNATINVNINVAGIDIQAGYTGGLGATITQAAGVTVTVGASNYTQAAGTFTGGNGGMTLNGAWSLSGGTFNLGSQTVTAKGNWTYTAGTIAGTGTVAFGTPNASLTITGSHTLPNVTIDPNSSTCCGSATIAIATGTTLTVSGTLTFNNTNVSPSAVNINTGTIAAQGNLTVSNTVDYSGTATLNMTGGANQTFTGPATGSISTPGSTLTINKSAGTVTLASNVSFAGTRSLTITAGTLDLAGFNLTVNGIFTIGASGTLALQSGETVTTPTINAGGTVQYNGTAASYTIKSWSYSNIEIAGGSSTTYSPPGNLTGISGLTVTTGTFSQGTADISATTFTTGTAGRYQNWSSGDLTIGSGGVSNSGIVTLDGSGGPCGGSDAILIRSSAAGTQRAWTGAGTFYLADVDVQDQAGTATIKVLSGTNTGNNGSNWTFASSCTDVTLKGGVILRGGVIFR